MAEVGASELRESLKTSDAEILKFSNLLNPYRILIMRTLTISGEADFRDLKHALNLTTEGNLVSHLNALQNAGYIVIRTRQISAGKKMKIFGLTNEGMRAFEEFGRLMSQVTNFGE